MKAIILIPCFNEEKNISGVIRNILTVSEAAAEYGCEIDYIVINDCSTDGTPAVLSENDYNYLSLPSNLGIGGAMQTGYRYAYEQGYDIALQHDGDGQHDPAYFKDVISPIAEGQADIVIGSRFIDKQGFQSSKARRLGIGVISSLIRLFTGIKIYDVTSGYRAVNRKYIELYARSYAQDYPEPEAIMEAAMYKAQIKEVPVVMRERMHGESSIGKFKSLYYMVKVCLVITLHKMISARKVL